MLCKEYQTKNANQLIFKRLAFYHVLEAEYLLFNIMQSCKS